jgi:hypothetical protein
MTNIDIKRGEYLLIAVDGTEIRVYDKPRLPVIEKFIGCNSIDTVILKKRGGEPSVIMVVDDTGIDGKPVNPKATELYHSICKPGTVYAIHGNVAIVNDKDF